jgi:hypothetical protein
MKFQEIPEARCICCGRVVNAVYSEIALGEPIPGDLTLCEFCGTFMVFDGDLGLRRPSAAMRLVIAKHPGCQMSLHYLRMKWMRN